MSEKSGNEHDNNEYDELTLKQLIWEYASQIGKWFVIFGLIVISFQYINWNYILYCYTPEHGYQTYWELPPGEYKCAICKTFMNETEGRQYITETCHYALVQESDPITQYTERKTDIFVHGPIWFKQLIGGYENE